MLIALRHPNFRRFITGQFLSLLGTWVQQVALAWVVYQMTGSAFAVGIVTAAGTAPVLLLTIYGGGVADRVDRRRALLVLQSLLAVEAFLLAVLAYAGWLRFGWIVALALFGGIVSAFEIPVRQSFLLDLVGRTDLMHAIALNSMAFSVSRVIGPAVGGLLLAGAGATACFFLNGVSFSAVLIGLARVRLEGAPPRPAESPPAMHEVVRYFQTPGWPRTIAAHALVVTVFIASITWMLPVYAHDILATGAEGYGILMSAYGVGAAVGAMLIALGKTGPRGRLVVATGGMLGLLHLAVAVVHLFPAAVALLVVSGGVGAVSGISANTILQVEAPPRLRGKVIGVYAAIVVGMAPVGALLAGSFADRFGVDAAIGAGGGIALLAAVWLWWHQPGGSRPVARNPHSS